MSGAGRLATTAMLARIEVRTWTARVADAHASANLTDNAGAIRSAASVRKNLLAGCDSALRATQAAAQYVRALHRDLTLPWTESERILPACDWRDYAEKTGRAIASFEEHAASAVRDYERARERARTYLGDLWREREYPTPGYVASRFVARSVVLPFPALDAADWRVVMADAERAALATQARAAVAERLADATRDLWDRLCTRLENVAGVLDSDRTVRDALVSDTRALLARLSRMNVLDDAAFAGALHDVAEALALDAPTIRASDTARADAARKAADLARQYRSAYGVVSC